MINSKLVRIIKHSIKYFKLDLSGYNILLPASEREPALAPIMASMAGAKNIYVAATGVETVNKTTLLQNELGLNSNITFIETETPQILAGLDIVIKGDGISHIDKKFVSGLKENCVISLLPHNFDFHNINGINLEDCADEKIPVVAVNPNDQSLMLFRYFAHLIIKRCYEANLDVFRSRILLVGHGDLLENALSLLKAAGAQVYVAYTDRPQNENYIIKHLPEIDGIVVVDYPEKSEIIIGNEGLIKIEDLVDTNPEVKIIHLSGKVQVNPLILGRISYIPEVITQNSLNVNIQELGLRAIVESTAAVMKVAETLIKTKNRTVQQNESIVSYNIINADGPVVLEESCFRVAVIGIMR